MVLAKLPTLSTLTTIVVAIVALADTSQAVLEFVTITIAVLTDTDAGTVLDFATRKMEAAEGALSTGGGCNQEVSKNDGVNLHNDVVGTLD